jgi:hypothetical protein
MPVFMPVVEKVERLVRKQVRQLLAMKRKPKVSSEHNCTAVTTDGMQAILLVGGFGTNMYLAKRLKETYELRDGGDESPIEVLQPNIGFVRHRGNLPFDSSTDTTLAGSQLPMVQLDVKRWVSVT